MGATSKTETGRIATFVGARKAFELDEYAVPAPGPGAAIIRIERASICGSDLHIWRGEDPAIEQIAVTKGIALGHETVGHIARLGAGADKDAAGHALQEGDAVVFPYFTPCWDCRACATDRPHTCAQTLRTAVLKHADAAPHFVGGFADYLVVPRAATLVGLPDGLGVDDVIGANCAVAQALFALRQVGIKRGDRVAVQGAGGLGLFAVAGALAAGAERVIAIDAVPERLEAARALGATGVIDVREITDPKARVTAAKDLLGGPADVVVEVAGVPGVIAEGLRMLDRGGRYAEVGTITPDGDRLDMPASQLVQRNLSIVGVGLYHPEILVDVVELLAQLKGHPVLAGMTQGRRYALGSIDEAFKDLDATQDLARPVLDMTA